ncbi:MAG: nucleotide exchange factor GrpE [Planctomycetaceae bacterium]|jgi:molecular chaperone GrpE|nr:nucleotide exchange factor GrpE [Planctomycetaceae bacterium]
MLEHEFTSIQQPNEPFQFSSETVSETVFVKQNISENPNFILVPTETEENKTETVVAGQNFILVPTEAEENETENIAVEENLILNQAEAEENETEEEEENETENDIEEDFFLNQIRQENFDINFEQILSKFREETLKHFIDWFTSREETDEKEEALPKIGFYQVFETLTAQRHEFKLFTKSNRQTQEILEKNIEQTSQMFEQTSQTLEQLRRLRKERPEIERKAIQPYLTSLIEIDESLQRAGAALKVLQDRLTGLVFERISTLAKSYCDELTLWQRFWQRKAVRHFAEHLANQHIMEIERILEPFRLGYEMMQSRMDDVLKKHFICRLTPIGEPVDPETMRVIATVETETTEPGNVVEVVRAGYLWRNKPVRFADVRVAVQPQIK